MAKNSGQSKAKDAKSLYINMISKNNYIPFFVPK